MAESKLSVGNNKQHKLVIEQSSYQSIEPYDQFDMA